MHSCRWLKENSSSSRPCDRRENGIRVLQDGCSEPAPEKEDRKDYGKEFDSERERLLLNLGRRLKDRHDESQNSADDDRRTREDQDEDERLIAETVNLVCDHILPK